MSIAAGCSVPWDWRPDAHAAQWHRRQPHIVLRKLFDSGYVTQADAYSCMRVCRQWHERVNGAKKLWRRIEFHIDIGFSQKTFSFANWSDGMASAIAAKRPLEIAICDSTAKRQHVSAILERCVHLQRLTLEYCDVDTVRALDSIVAPLTSLRLSSINDDEDAVFTEMVASSPMLKLLKELRLYAICIDDATMQLIAAEFTQLNVLQMTDSRDKLTPAGVRHLCADGTHTRTTLRELNLDCCYHIENDIAEDVLALPNLETLSVEYIDVCTDEWAADLRRRYEERHNRRIVVLTAVESDGELDSDLDEWDEWPDYDDDDGEYDYDVSQDEGDDY